jgi:hypothetical protein
LKLSGEALMGDVDYGIDPAVIKRIAGEVSEVRKLGIEVAIVIGGGNIFRGAGLAGAGMDRVTGDYMGMLCCFATSVTRSRGARGGLHEGTRCISPRLRVRPLLGGRGKMTGTALPG